jgi:hypothetical protein
MKIRFVFLFYSLLIVIIFGVVFLYYCFLGFREVSKSEIAYYLNYVAEEKAKDIKNFIFFQKEIIKTISLKPEFKSLLEEYEQIGKNSDETYKKAIIEINNTYSQLGDDIVILSKDGLVLASLKDQVDTNFIENNDDLQNKINFVVFYDQGQKKNRVAVINPVFSLNNNLSGFIAGVIDIEELAKAMDIGKDGKLKDGYLIRSDGLLLTPSKDKGTVLVQKVNAETTAECVKNFYKSEETSGNDNLSENSQIFNEAFYNFRGEMVMESNYPLSDVKWCVILEADPGTINNHWKKILPNFILIFVCSMFAIGLTSYFWGRYVEKKMFSKKAEATNSIYEKIFFKTPFYGFAIAGIFILGGIYVFEGIFIGGLKGFNLIGQLPNILTFVIYILIFGLSFKLNKELRRESIRTGAILLMLSEILEVIFSKYLLSTSDVVCWIFVYLAYYAGIILILNGFRNDIFSR